ncbi:MAG: hypothetical protein L6R40_006337 [Gallowayella cf. fulva]|nr:MAG: hypothetical protein L6R40_006337 [Xanthomendoza cf. fulva]
MAPTLLSLPTETLLAVASYLNSAADYIHLSRAHQSIARKLEDRRVVAKTVKRVAGYSTEWELVSARALSPLDALHSIYDRQQAISTAQPASAVILGDGQSFLYQKGLLVYVRDDLIRILDVHNARRTEGVICNSVIGTQLLGIDCEDSEVELLHLQDGLLTFIYHGETRVIGWISFVLVIDVTQYHLTLERLSVAVRLWTPKDIVVRNDRQHVCMITSDGLSADGHRSEWVCRSWNLDNLPVEQPTVQIPGLAINELGQSLVFELYDGFLYAISTQPSREMDDPEWTSHYTCLRLPLNHSYSRKIERIRIWRRHHQEGPINDLWTDLRLVRDEMTGELTIIEARKEWTGGSSSQRRTWYRQSLAARFPRSDDMSDEDETMMDFNEPDSSVHGVSQPQNMSSASISTDSPYLFAVPPNVEQYPPDPSLGQDQPPHPSRLPCNTHPEYPTTASSPSTGSNAILARSKHRTYVPSAAAFFDLVVDDRQIFPRSAWAEQLRLRIGSRREVSPLDDQGKIHPHLFNPYTGQPLHDSEKRYEDKGIHSWPPADAPAALQDLLNGSTAFQTSSDGYESRCKMLGEVNAVSDERSIIYLVKEKDAADDDKGRLILVNFDQYIQFSQKKWAPSFIDLYGDHESDRTAAKPRSSTEVVIDGEAQQIYDTLDVKIDEPVGQDMDEDEGDEDDSQPDESLSFQPADDIIDLFWCEEFEEDEPVNLPWFMEQMALWTEYQEGFCFV